MSHDESLAKTYNERLQQRMNCMEELELETKLEALRDKWAEQAHLIESVYGPDKPEVRLLRLCISDLHATMFPKEF